MSRFDEARARIGRFGLAGRTLLMPQMNAAGTRLLAAAFRAAGVPTEVVATGRGEALAREFTSGKECYPCHVTLGDILHHLRAEQARLGAGFRAGDYAYFLPESEGPCRLGMYNVLHRLALDRFPELREVPVVSITSRDAYSAAGMLPEREAPLLRRLAYNVMILADALDRALWRVRPYEVRPGAADERWEEGLQALERAVAAGGLAPDYGRLLDLLADAARGLRTVLDEAQPRRPRIGIVGEMYVRNHPWSNQEVIRRLERFGGEVVNASVGEWAIYISYLGGRRSRSEARRALGAGRPGEALSAARRWVDLQVELRYLAGRQRRALGRVREHLDIQAEHPMAAVERSLDGDRHYSFDVATETPLSIGGALGFVHDGFDGIVNVFPFTCMPSTLTSAVVKPLMNRLRIPYLDTPYDSGVQPGREAAIRTFMYQAHQHYRRHGRKAHGP